MVNDLVGARDGGVADGDEKRNLRFHMLNVLGFRVREFVHGVRKSLEGGRDMVLGLRIRGFVGVGGGR
jgi:hypothetical protein